MSTSDQREARRTRILLLVLIAVAIAARLGAVRAVGRGDHPGWEYGNIAWHLKRGDGFVIRLNHLYPPDIAPLMKTRSMMPFYPYLVAGARVLSPRSHVLLYILQSLVSGAAAFILFRLGSAVYGTRAALLSTGLFCVYPSFIYACTIPHPLCWEFTALLLALLACRTFLARGGRARLVACALATMWAVYIRSAWIVLVPITIALLLLAGTGWKRYLRSVVLYCLIVIVGVSPWAVRNYIEFGSPSLTSIDFPLWEGHNSLGHPTGYDASGRKAANVRLFHPELAAELDAVMYQGEAAVQRVFREAALKEIRERPMLNLAVLPAKRIFYFLFWGPYHPKARSWLLYRLPYLAILIPAVAGLILSWRSPETRFRFGRYCVLGVWLAGCVTVAVFHYLPRFRMPAELMFMLPGGYFLDRTLSWIGLRGKSGQVAED